jgi:hypothetical protein
MSTLFLQSLATGGWDESGLKPKKPAQEAPVTFPEPLHIGSDADGRVWSILGLQEAGSRHDNWSFCCVCRC